MEKIIENIVTNNLVLTSNQSIFSSSYYFEAFYDDREIAKFIKATKKIIRNSKEYKLYMKSIKSLIPALARDNIMSNIDTDKAEIEMHHYPLNIESIIEIVMNHHIFKGIKFNSFTLAKEILDMHFENIIGLVPLSSTNHQLYHVGKLFIKNDQIFGDYNVFVNRYKESISTEDLEFIDNINKYSDKNVPSDFAGLLNTK